LRGCQVGSTFGGRDGRAGRYPVLEALKGETICQVREQYTYERVKDGPLFRVCRDLFWKVGVDPTWTALASEALVRRVPARKVFLTISTTMDAYNLASNSTGIPGRF
jgi:DNA/RNA-binding domain of Phe-tRNA-synthetase-like protein